MERCSRVPASCRPLRHELVAGDSGERAGVTNPTCTSPARPLSTRGTTAHLQRQHLPHTWHTPPNPGCQSVPFTLHHRQAIPRTSTEITTLINHISSTNSLSRIHRGSIYQLAEYSLRPSGPLSVQHTLYHDTSTRADPHIVLWSPSPNIVSRVTYHSVLLSARLSGRLLGRGSASQYRTYPRLYER